VTFKDLKKLQIGEDAEYDKVIARYRSQGLDENWSQRITQEYTRDDTHTGNITAKVGI
jgi:hypothetical protein